MQIAYINGIRVRRALIVGAGRLIENAAELNGINVFPVPDGDTGTNMAVTMRSMSHALRTRNFPAAGRTFRTAADSALDGARGNSGTILAQFIHCLANELEGEIKVSARAFAAALRKAVDSTYLALSRPKEGTILTILRDWSEAVHRLSQATDDILVILRDALDEAKASLARTQEMLPELKKAGVVDAGAQGFFHIIEGIVHYIHHGKIRDIDENSREEKPEPEVIEEIAIDPNTVLSFRYCTECSVTGESIDLEGIREALEPRGDSLIVAGSSQRAKIHIHSDEPMDVFHILERFGTLEGRKTDDMELQRRIAASPRRKCFVLVDSTADLPDELRLDLLVERVPVQISFGETSYSDRDGLAASDFYSMMRKNSEVLPSTSQPAHSAFLRKMDFLLSRADGVAYIALSDVLSGTCEGGRRAAQASKDPSRVKALDSKGASLSCALIARKAARAAASGADLSEVEALVADLVPRTHVLFTVPSLENLVKSGRVKRSKKLIADALRLHPILTITREGKADTDSYYIGAKNGQAKLLSRMKGILKNAGCTASDGEGRIRLSDVAVGHTGALEEADRMAETLKAAYIIEDEILRTDISPALAVHVGLDAVAIAFIVPRK